MEALPKAPRKRLEELDGLRGLAALSVVLFHYTTRYDELFDHTGETVANATYGYLGVQLFFIISGFVILMTVARTASVKDFAFSRFSRLYPAYWASLTLTLVVLTFSGLWPHGPLSSADAILNFTMIQGFINRPHVDGVYWTLQVELTFYAMIAVALLFRQLKNIEWVATGMLGLTVIHWFVGNISLVSSDAIGRALNFGLVQIAARGNLPFFVTGMMIYLCWKERWTGLRLAVVGMAVLVTFLTSGALLGAVHILFGSAITMAVFGFLPILKRRPFVFLGFISYSLYLLHQYVGYVVIYELEKSGLNSSLAILCTIITLVTLATVFAKAIEQPSLRWLRDRYRKRSTIPGIDARTDAAVHHTAVLERGVRPDRSA